MRYHESTEVNFTAISVEDARGILDEYVKVRRRKNVNTFEFKNRLFTVDYASEKKLAWKRARSNSYYFLSGEYVYRISDHWSESKFPTSKKLNCGSIASCYWTNKRGEKFEYRLPGEKYESVLIAGRAKLSSFKKR